MTLSLTEVISSFLANPRSRDHATHLASDDFIYVSLNYGDNELKKVMRCGAPAPLRTA